jgi:predicted transposase YbfD/YdcC
LLKLLTLKPATKQKEVHMKYITLDENGLSGVVFDVGEFLTYMEKLTDSRKARGKRYSLAIILVMITLAKLAQHNKPAQVAEWIRLRRRALVKAFNLKRASVPSLNTIRRALAHVIDIQELEQLLRQFLHKTYGGRQSVLIVLDGKTLRGTIPAGHTQGVHLLAAYLPEEGIVLMQVTVAKKENEISAAPRVLEQLDLRNKVVCGDAMFTQRELSVQILAQGGDYIWFIKENQPRLRTDVEQFFVPPRKAAGWHTPQLPQDTAQTVDKGNGRIDKRTITVMEDENSFLDWPGVQRVFKLERERHELRANKVTKEVVYGITSLPSQAASAEQLLQWTRSHWGIENGLHYRRDKTLAEDDTRMETGKLPQAIALLNNFIVGLTLKLGFTNLASAQRVFDAKIDETLFGLT